MLDDRHYSQENILIHEFAHSVMCIGMDDEQRLSICAAFEEAQRSGSYQRHIYMMENADEYWAEATQSWFDATVRTGKSCMPPIAVLGRTPVMFLTHILEDDSIGSFCCTCNCLHFVLFYVVMEHPRSNSCSHDCSRLTCGALFV